jgi:hypothetical protein
MKLDEEHSSGKPYPASCVTNNADYFPDFCYQFDSQQSVEAATNN